MKVLETKKELLNSMRFIGQRYTDQNRDQDNSFNEQWQDWINNDRFKTLANNRQPLLNGKYIGFMNTLDDNSYWIGYLFAKDEFIPRGYDFFDLYASEVLVATIEGSSKNGEIYSVKAIDTCIDTFIEQDYFNTHKMSQEWFFEAYDPEKFQIDSENTKLDYYFKIRKATIEDQKFLEEAKQMKM